MMSIKVKTVQQVKVTHLWARMGVRYWEDGSVNGVQDDEGNLIPHRDGDDWELIIDLKSGTIIGWPDDVTADVHYKVCDDGIYELLDGSSVVAKKAGYVPSMLAPNGDGFGDYVVLKIDGDGKIDGWKPDLTYFEDEQ